MYPQEAQTAGHSRSQQVTSRFLHRELPTEELLKQLTVQKVTEQTKKQSDINLMWFIEFKCDLTPTQLAHHNRGKDQSYIFLKYKILS